MSNRRLYFLAGILALIALLIFGYKAALLGFPLRPHEQAPAWELEVRVGFQASGEPVRLSLRLPSGGNGYEIADEQFVSGGYGVNTRSKAGNRAVVWSSRHPEGEQFLYYRARVRPGAPAQTERDTTAPVLESPDFEGARQAAAVALVEEVRGRSADAETLVTELLRLSRVPAEHGHVAALYGHDPTLVERLHTTVEVLTAAGVGARVVHGVRLQSLARHAGLQHWLEVFDRGTWRAFDPHSGVPGIPEEYLPWWYGDLPLAQLRGGQHLHTKIALIGTPEPALRTAAWRERRFEGGWAKLSLLDLPVETRAVYMVLLTVPVGVFLLVIARNLIGIKTFGTFMPVLIALAFRETQLLWGLVLFSLLVALGLAVRFYLDRLKLLLVPRLAAVLIVVILLMLSMSLVSQQLGLHRALSVALFPMVILAMTIERMTVVWEERGAREALQQGFGSLMVATFAYGVMNIDLVEHLVFVFPELLLLILAATLLLGRYTGYRLSELARFRAFGGRA